MDTKNIIAAISLSLAIIVMWSLFFQPSPEELKKRKEKEKIVNSSDAPSIDTNEKITNLFKNFDTMSFVQLIINYNYLLNNGYNKDFLNQSLHSLLSLPFLLLLMTGLAAILTMGTLKKSDNLRLIVLGLIICVLMFYFKDLSLALGQTGRIPLVLAVWAPVIALSLFMFIGVLQINEK